MRRYIYKMFNVAGSTGKATTVSMDLDEYRVKLEEFRCTEREFAQAVREANRSMVADDALMEGQSRSKQVIARALVLLEKQRGSST